MYLIIMKKLLFLTCAFIACVSFWSCSSDHINPDIVSNHDYDSDAEVLNKFVDVNKVTGEYYINDAKVITPMDYISNDDLTKLKEVSTLNRSRFEKELDILNFEIEEAAKSDSVSQIVYNLYGGKSWVRTIDEKYPMLITSSENKSQPKTRSVLSHMELVPNLPQTVSFNGPSTIESVVNINMFGYKAYSFRITTNDGTKTPSGDYPAGGGSNPKAIVLTGMGSSEQYTYEWYKTSGGTSWTFVGTLLNPSSIGNFLITVDFYD